jgi:carbonic anhydrase
MPDRALLPPRLEAGYASFRAGAYAAARDRYRHLAEAGQQPATMVIGCSDSRSAPEAVFDAGPGELFVVRNVAALVPPYAPDANLHGVSAALEYAVLALRVSSVVVLGHGRCGGIAAALEGQEPLSTTDFVGAWIAGVRALGAALEAANLRTFPWVQACESRGELTLHGAWFDIASGELHARGDHGWVRVEPGGRQER